MAEEFQTGICGGEWWNLSKSSMFMGGSSPCSTTGSDNIGTYGSWVVSDIIDLKQRSCKDFINTNDININSVSDIFQDSQKPQQQQQQQQTDSDSGGSSVLMDSTLQMMGFGISSSSSPPSDWSQSLLRGNNSTLQEEQKDWCTKSFNTSTVDQDSSINAYKAINNQDFSLTSSGNSTVTAISSSFPVGSAATYSAYPSTLVQTLFDSNDHPQPQQSLFDSNRSMNYSNYGTILNELSPSWPKLAPFLKPSLPKQQPLTGLNFSNNTPFWNASAASVNDLKSGFLASSQPQFLLPVFDEKPSFQNLTTKLNNEEVRDSGSSVVKKGSEPAFKRPRIETPSPLPTFKVRKEKLGDRITALQQLVSPFGKTDTASVLHEAIEYIKFLHDQVNVLSTPYMKNGNPIQHQQVAEKSSKDLTTEGSKQDLRSRGLCLVPISSTFPVTNETTADFWTPTFGGTFSNIVVSSQPKMGSPWN